MPEPLTPEEQEVFDECLRGLISGGVDDRLIISEYHRELGDFGACLALLDDIYGTLEGGRKEIADMIRDHALAGDRKTFVLQGIQKRLSLIPPDVLFVRFHPQMAESR